MQEFIDNSIQDTDNINSNFLEGRKGSVLHGIPSSPGIAFGKAKLLVIDTIISPDKKISKSVVPKEIERFDSAINELVREFEGVLGKVEREAKNVMAVLETNLFILSDDVLIDSIKARIQSGISVESSVVREFESQKQYLKKAKDALLRERAIDLDNMMYKLLSVLKKKTINYGFYKDSIVVANSVTPSDIVNFKHAGILGIITEVGGISSHSSILTRNYEIPEIIGLNNATQIITEDTFLILDGYTGSLTLNPTEDTVRQYRQKKNLQEEHKKKLGDLLKLPSKTKDGKKINLLANLDFPEDVETAVMAGSEGIGLVRSENLLIKLGYFPGEDEQYEWYKSFAERSYPRPVTIRAYDVGSDKFAEGVPIHESNPALGYRGIRFLLKREDIFRTQVRAVLRASKTKNIHFMIPMLTSLGELLLSLKLINQCKIELSKEEIEFDDKMPVGVMIETPAAALISSKLAEYVQFFSIGTNDLTQYTLAADRTNELVVDYYNSFHPAVLRLIKLTTEGAAKSNISVNVCGEFAGHSAATSLLIGLGVTGLSASPSVLPELKNRIRTIDSRESIVLAEDILKLSSYSKIAKRLEKSS